MFLSTLLFLFVGPFYIGNKMAYCILVWNLNAVYLFSLVNDHFPVTFDVDPVHLLRAATTASLGGRDPLEHAYHSFPDCKRTFIEIRIVWHTFYFKFCCLFRSIYR